MVWSSNHHIQEGDLVIIWLTREFVQPLVVNSGKEFGSKFGSYRHSDLIGLPYGSKVGSRTGRGFIHVLRPTPELWTMALPHRTQILYLADIAFITSWLNIKPGSKVIEAGTGSGSFSHSITRTIGPAGHLWSYEFHEVRASKAREEFARHGMSDVVTLVHRNVCKEGFTVVDTVDSAFLDLPAPWDAVEYAKKALRKDRLTRICCFSPCMEQVLRTVSSLNEAGFTDITMYETLMRPYETHQIPAAKSVRDVGEDLKVVIQKREDKRQRQIASSRFRNQPKRKREGSVEELGDEGSKKIKTDEEDEAEADIGVALADPANFVLPENRSSLSPRPTTTSVHNRGTLNVSNVFPEVRGHTSYLTFACLVPQVSPTTVTEQNSTSAESMDIVSN